MKYSIEELKVKKEDQQYDRKVPGKIPKVYPIISLLLPMQTVERW